MTDIRNKRQILFHPSPGPELFTSRIRSGKEMQSFVGMDNKLPFFFFNAIAQLWGNAAFPTKPILLDGLVHGSSLKKEDIIVHCPSSRASLGN